MVMFGAALVMTDEILLLFSMITGTMSSRLSVFELTEQNGFYDRLNKHKNNSLVLRGDSLLCRLRLCYQLMIGGFSLYRNAQ